MNKTTYKTQIGKYYFCLTTPINLYSQSLFFQPTLQSGPLINKLVQKYYTNVTTVDGTSVDAIVTIVNIVDATIIDIDNAVMVMEP
jgi:hypothetical protein